MSYEVYYIPEINKVGCSVNADHRVECQGYSLHFILDRTDCIYRATLLGYKWREVYGITNKHDQCPYYLSVQAFKIASDNVSDETKSIRRKSRLGFKMPEGTGEKISKKLLGIPKSQDHRKSLSDAYHKVPLKKCKWCGYTNNSPAFYRWHNDNCKHNPSTARYII